MIAVANIKIGNQLIGVVFWDELQNLGLLEIDKNYLKHNQNLAPIIMPISELEIGKLVFSFPELNSETFRGLPGLLSESLSNGFAVKILENYIEIQNKSNFSPVDALCFIADNGIGALEFESFDKKIDLKSNTIEIQDLIDFINHNEESDFKNSKFNVDFYKITSICKGKNPKAVLSYNNEIKEFCIGKKNHFDEYVLKFGIPNDTFSNQIKIEYAYYLMALDCGITISETQLLSKNNVNYLVTKRFDRLKNQKIHFQTLCSLAHFDASNSGYYSYEQAFEILRQLKLPNSDAEQLFRRMVFNVIARNQNDTTEKIGFLMLPNGKWQLAPAFGLNYENDTVYEKHQMSINQKTKNIFLEDLLIVAKNCNIKKPKKIIECCNEILFNWDEYAKKAGLASAKIIEIERELLIIDL